MHENFAEMLPVIISVIFISGFFAPTLTNLIAYLTIVLKLVAFIIVYCIKGREGINASSIKIGSYLVSDILIYILAFGTIVEMYRGNYSDWFIERKQKYI